MTEVLIVLIKLSIACIILSVGANAAPADVGYLWRRPGLLLRSLLAMYVLVPLMALLLVSLIPETAGVGAALLVLGVSSGAPLLPRKLKALRSHQYIFSLLVTSSLMAIIAVPLWIALLSVHFARTLQLSPVVVAFMMAKTILLPVAIGMGLHLAWPRWTEKLADRLMTVAGLVLAACGLALLVSHAQILLGIGWHGVVGLAAFLIAALTIGHLLGGPDQDDRTALAVICATRHIGVALAIAITFSGTKVPVLIVGYVITTGVLTLLYLAWRRRRAAATHTLESTSR
jgi:bile acid:Na+ symporter, BASS family